jgi:hypothetical protein
LLSARFRDYKQKTPWGYEEKIVASYIGGGRAVSNSGATSRFARVCC